MGVTAMTAVFSWGDAAPWTPSQRLILLALADHANDEGFCWPGIRKVARKCAIAEATTLRYLKDLEVDGWIERLKRRAPDGRQMTTLYRLSPRLLAGPPVAASDDAETAKPQDVVVNGNDTKRGDKLSPRQGDNSCESGVTILQSRGDNPAVDIIDESSVQQPPNKPPPPEETGGGQVASPGQEEKETAPDGGRSLGPLGDKLIDLGVTRVNAERILVNVDHRKIRGEIARFIEERKDGSLVQAGFLVDVIYGRKAWGVKPVKPKRKRKAEEPGYMKRPESKPPEPVREVCLTCQLCGTESTSMSDEDWRCPNCGCGVINQNAVMLVEKGLWPQSRLDRLPAKAREILKAKRDPASSTDYAGAREKS